MKKLIRNIIREQTSNMGEGKLSDFTSSVGGALNIPAETIWANGKKVILPIPSKNVFFKVVKQLVLTNPESILDEDDMSYDDRSYYMDNTLKLFGISSVYEALVNKIFWAAVDNRELMEKGEINNDINFDDLVLRPYKKYSVECSESWQEYIYYTWRPIVEAYDKDDAANKVYSDEDGYYQYYEWENEPGFTREVGDADSDGKEVESVTEIGVVNESRIIKENESPDENELIDGLRNILNKQKEAHSEDTWYNDITKLLKKLDISLK